MSACEKCRRGVRCSRFSRGSRRERRADTRSGLGRASNADRRENRRNPEGESAWGHLAALAARLQPAVGMLPRVRLAIWPQAFSRTPLLLFSQALRPAAVCLLALCLAAGNARAEEARVREAVDAYFEAWSRQDMQAYAAAFHPEAVIFFVAPDGSVERSGVARFVESQRIAHERSEHPMREVPETTEVAVRGGYATAFVFWRLTAGPREQTGVNAFTFVNSEGRWRILSLVFAAAE